MKEGRSGRLWARRWPTNCCHPIVESMPLQSVAQKTTPLRYELKKVDMGDLVGRGLGVGGGRQDTSATHMTSPPRDVPINSTRTADQVLKGVGVSANVPLLKRIHQEAASATSFASGGEPARDCAERGKFPGMPRRGIGFDGGLKRRGHRATQRGQEQIDRMVPATMLSMTQ